MDIFFPDRHEKHKLSRIRWYIVSWQVLLNSVKWFQRGSRKMSQLMRGQVGHLVFPIGLKYTKFEGDVEIFLPVKFRWNPFSRFRGEVENYPTGERPWCPSCFSDRLENHKRGRERCVLSPCHVLLNSAQRFQNRSRKYLSHSDARVAILFCPIGPEKHKFADDVEILLLVKFRWIRFSDFRGQVKNVSANQTPGRSSCFFHWPKQKQTW